jgi:hypothetical protein
MQHPVLQLPLLQHLARMLGNGKRHRGLQSRPLRSGATLPSMERTPSLIGRVGRLPLIARAEGATFLNCYLSRTTLSPARVAALSSRPVRSKVSLCPSGGDAFGRPVPRLVGG